MDFSFSPLGFHFPQPPPRCEQSACVSRIIVPRSFLSRFAFLCRVSGCCLGCQIHPTVTQNRPSPTARLGSWQALLPQTSSLAFTGPPCWDSQPQACRVSSQTVLFSWGCSTVFSSVPKPSPWPPCFPMSLQLPTLFNLCHSEGLLGLVVLRPNALVQVSTLLKFFGKLPASDLHSLPGRPFLPLSFSFLFCFWGFTLKLRLVSTSVLSLLSHPGVKGELFLLLLTWSFFLHAMHINPWSTIHGKHCFSIKEL